MTSAADIRPRAARRGRTRLTTLAGAVALVAALAACSTPGASDAASDDQLNPTDVSTDLGSDPIELTLYDGAGLKSIDDALIAAFEEQHPNVTITGRYDPDDVQATNSPRVLSSDDPPDIARIIALADTVQDGLLTNLDAYADAYSWGDLPAGQLAQYTVSDDGVRGEGSQYTLASGFTVTGFYYNLQLAQQIGMTEPPQTLEELQTVLATAKAAGITPLMAGNQTGGLALSLQMMLNNSAGADFVNGWVFHDPDATIDTPEAVTGVDVVNNWIEQGYYNPDTNGTDGTTAVGRFANGEALFYPSGNWEARTLDTQMAGNVGFFLPPTGDTGAQAAMSDPASNFGIPAKSDNKDAAAAFLDFLTSPEARQIVVDNGFAPSGTGDVPTTTDGSVNSALQTAFADLVDADGQVQFVQNATNGIGATWNSEVQLLAAGETTPEELLAAIQAQYEDELGR